MARTVYCVNTNDNPQAMPLGTGVMSRHDSLVDAKSEIEDEMRDFHESMYSIGGGYLQRCITVQEPGEYERLVTTEELDAVDELDAGS